MGFVNDYFLPLSRQIFCFLGLRHGGHDQAACNSEVHELTASLEPQFVSSPNFPDTYGDNLDCKWTIRKNLNVDLMITILSFQTESCCDYLKVNLCK